AGHARHGPRTRSSGRPRCRHRHPGGRQSPPTPQGGRMSQLDIVLLTGISGSGKSVALNALEDAGYFCVDNLPPELLRGLVDLEVQRPPELKRRVAVAMDV